MALFHAFTGSDNTSAFKFKGKRYCFKTKNEDPSLMETFTTFHSTPFYISPQLRRVAMQFVCRLYTKEPSMDDSNNVDLVRMKVFCHKTRDVERIPPISDALDLHLQRTVFQASIWTAAHKSIIPTQDHCNHGWMKKDNKLIPVWTTLPLAQHAFDLQVKCSCTKTCSLCKCCTRLCKCDCAK